MIIAIFISTWQIWTNIEGYIAWDNLVTNPSSESVIGIMERNADLLDNVIMYRYICLLLTIVLAACATNTLYNNARTKITHFDLSSKYSKKRAVGSFFIPVANLVLPRLRINELEHILRLDNPNLYDKNSFKEKNRKERNKVGDCWWILCISSGLIHGMINNYFEPVFQAEENLNGLAAEMNKYLFSETIVSILFIASMVSGIKYFEYLFKLGNYPRDPTETEAHI